MLRLMRFLFGVLVLFGFRLCHHVSWYKQVIPVKYSRAKVFVDGAMVGVTPIDVRLKRDKPHRTGLSMPGHELELFELEPVECLFGTRYCCPGCLRDPHRFTHRGIYDFDLESIDHRMVKKVTVPQVQYH